MNIFKAHFGQRLKQALMRAGLKQTELAAKLGVKPSAVSRWVNGIDFPDKERILDLANALGIEPSDFVADGRSEADQQRAKIRTQLDQQTPSEKQMGEFVFEILEENKSLRSEVAALKKTTDAIPTAVLETWPRADEKVKAVCLFLLTGRDEELKALPAAFRQSMQKGFSFLGLSPQGKRAPSAK